jgi:4-oxalocrotonate tautomerase
LGTVAVFDLTGIIGTGSEKTFKALSLEGSKENNMPHVSVKLWPGRSEQTKQRLADALVEDVVNIVGCDDESVSVAIEEVRSQDWKEEVYEPDIVNGPGKLYKKPGYKM